MARDPVLIHAANARRAGETHRVRPDHIMGILKVEGGTAPDGRPVRPGDGLGPPSYGQFITATGRALGVKYGDSASETDAIARYLNQLGYQKDPRRAIAAYNGGPGNPQYGYAAKVLAAAKRYTGLSNNIELADPALMNLAPTTATGGGGLFSGRAQSALRAMLWIALVLGGAALAAQGAARIAGVKGPLELARGKAAPA